MAGPTDLDVSFETMKADYLRRVPDFEVLPNAYYIRGRGFISARFDQYNQLWVEQVYGDLRYWLTFSLRLARERKATGLLFHTERPKAYKRLANASVVSTLMEIDPWAEHSAHLADYWEAPQEPEQQQTSSDKVRNESSERSHLRLVPSGRAG